MLMNQLKEQSAPVKSNWFAVKDLVGLPSKVKTTIAHAAELNKMNNDLMVY